MWIYISSSCTWFKKRKRKRLLTYCSNIFQNSPCIAHPHRDLSTQLGSSALLLLTWPVPAKSKAGKVIKLQRASSHMFPCLLCVHMDLLLHVRWKEELQDITSGGVSLHTAFPAWRCRLILLSSHSCQLKISIKLVSCVQTTLGSMSKGWGKMKKTWTELSYPATTESTAHGNWERIQVLSSVPELCKSRSWLGLNGLKKWRN